MCGAVFCELWDGVVCVALFCELLDGVVCFHVFYRKTELVVVKVHVL